MDCYSKRCINLVTLIIAVIIFIQINYLTIKMLSTKNNEEKNIETKISKLEEKSDKTEKSFDNKNQDKQNEEWKLIIPKINISAIIKDGTESEIINSYIGHFKETAYDNGNIGLVASGKGYKENYFENLDKLEKNDVIIYKKGNIKKQYIVEKNIIIDETNWTYLSSTQDNKITLITCTLDDNLTKRRCVQAIEI